VFSSGGLNALLGILRLLHLEQFWLPGFDLAMHKRNCLFGFLHFLLDLLWRYKIAFVIALHALFLLTKSLLLLLGGSILFGRLALLLWLLDGPRIAVVNLLVFLGRPTNYFIHKVDLLSGGSARLSMERGAKSVGNPFLVLVAL
jgi:hypothetical protein